MKRVGGGRVVLQLTAAVLLFASCGSDEPYRQPPPPDASEERIELTWQTVYGGSAALTHAVNWRLVLERTGTFTLSWADSRASEEELPGEVLGQWRALNPGRVGWELRPGGGRAALEPGAFKEGEWPRLGIIESWPTNEPGDGPWQYKVPAVDATTGLFDDAVFFVRDPRSPGGFTYVIEDGELRMVPIK